VAEEEVGVGLVEALAGFAVDGQGVLGVVCRLRWLGVGKVDVGERGQGLSFEAAVADVVAESHGFACVGEGRLAVAGASAGHCQADEGDGLRVTHRRVADDLKRLTVKLGCLGVLGEASVAGGEGVEGVSLCLPVAGVAGEASAAWAAWRAWMWL
jgi:hypothetical protein